MKKKALSRTEVNLDLQIIVFSLHTTSYSNYEPYLHLFETPRHENVEY